MGGESGKMSEAQHVRQNTAGKIMNKPMPPPLKKAQKLLITRAFGDDGVKGGGVGEVATSSPGEKLGDKHLTRGTVQRGEVSGEVNVTRNPGASQGGVGWRGGEKERDGVAFGEEGLGGGGMAHLAQFYRR